MFITTRQGNGEEARRKKQKSEGGWMGEGRKRDYIFIMLAWG